jgi:hypothetical protein
MLACAWLPAASAWQQSSTADSASQKPATTQPSTHKHHKTTSSSSSSTIPVRTAHNASTHTAFTAKHSSRKKKSARVRGQQKIDSERARSIQEALIREHYLSGEAAGTWNQASEDAMRRYQGDHGWQTKEVPDSRALIKLGLGPSKDHLLNPESAMTTGPDAPRAKSQGPPATDPGSGPSPDKSNPAGPQ